MALQTGQILDGKYRIMREIGHGSMGAVYEGENIMIHRRVAIKVLHPAVAENASTVQRFEREAQAAGRIGSDHIVEVLDLGSLRDGSYYMVMEFLEGKTLSKRIRSRGRVAPREVAPIAQQLLTGLEAAHKAGIVHRDLKPDNVFLQENRAGLAEFVKILDFGVSKFNPLNAEEHLALTRAGAVVGTPFYMSPEQAKGSRDVDARADLYSVGVILYESITGQKPFHAGTFSELIFKIVLEAPPPPEHFVPDLDPAFSRIIRRAMAREPGERYQTAAEMRDALSIWLHTGRDVAPGTQLAAPLPPPPGAGMRSQPPPPPGSPEDANENAATRVIDDEGTATRVVDQSPLAGAPPSRAKPAATAGAAQAPPPPSRRPARAVLGGAHPAPGAGQGAAHPRTPTLPGPPVAHRPAAPALGARAAAQPAAAPGLGVPLAAHAGVAPKPAAAPAAAASVAAPSPAAAPTVPMPAVTPAVAAPAATAHESARTEPSAEPSAAPAPDAEPAADLASYGPTPPRGIPGLRPLASRRTLWLLGGGAAGVLALTAIGVGAVVVSSPPDETTDSTGAPASSPSSTPPVSLAAASTGPSTEAAADATAEPSAEATDSAAEPAETAAALAQNEQPPSSAPRAASPPGPAKSSTQELASAPTSVPTAAAPATSDTATGTTRTKGKGRSYATEL